MPISTAQLERQALCTLFEEVGPLAPTLCEGWTTSDLAAHLYVRERRPISAAGILVPPLASFTERSMESVKRDPGYEGLVRRVRTGPPFPWSLVDANVNLMEYFVHHEDVRRAQPEWEPRADQALDDALWTALRRSARLLTRRAHGVGVTLSAPNREPVTAKAGEPTATIEGGPQEIVLYLFGRRDAARVTLQGSDDATAKLAAARLGL